MFSEDTVMLYQQFFAARFILFEVATCDRSRVALILINNFAK